MVFLNHVLWKRKSSYNFTEALNLLRQRGYLIKDEAAADL